MKTQITSREISRRRFLQRTGQAGLALAGTSLAFAEEAKKPLRVIAYNVYGCTGWPRDRDLAKKAKAKGQMPDRFARELALYDPDIINFSESPDESIVKQIAKRLGMNSVRFPSGGNWPGTLLTRFEILDSENVPIDGERPDDLFTRHWGRATVRLPGGEPLIVHSAHLHPSKSGIRQREIAEMLKAMKSDLKAGRSMLLMGDLNHAPDEPEYKMWTETDWGDTFARAGNGKGLTIKADTPTRRIDYVMAAGPIAKQTVESRPLFEGAFRTNPSDPKSFALSDHLPQLAVFDLGK